jgi:hypothetical protein
LRWCCSSSTCCSIHASTSSSRSSSTCLACTHRWHHCLCLRLRLCSSALLGCGLRGRWPVGHGGLACCQPRGRPAGGCCVVLCHLRLHLCCMQVRALQLHPPCLQSVQLQLQPRCVAALHHQQQAAGTS